MSGLKLIVTGATGFVGREIIRQCLSHPDITEVIALARSSVAAPGKLPEGADPSKLKSIVIEDYTVYPPEVKKEFAGAAACIWTVAIMPWNQKTYDFEELKRVCHTSAIAGLRAMHESGPATPFRFLYMSGIAAERDQSLTPKFYPEYCLMRGDAENQLLALAVEFGDGVEVAAARPGSITASDDPDLIAKAESAKAAAGIPSIDVVDLVAAMINQVTRGFEKEPLTTEDMNRIAETLHKTI
ncbi:NAD(P)-binding protein [Astrocystis sublimbata]|nr:NAD(P)-binding protein [Astrocystis sublimbata]